MRLRSHRHPGRPQGEPGPIERRGRSPQEAVKVNLHGEQWNDKPPPLHTPLCPAGHLPHKGGDRLSQPPSPTTSVAGRAAKKAAGSISPLEGEMSGRTEGGAKGCRPFRENPPRSPVNRSPANAEAAGTRPRSGRTEGGCVTTSPAAQLASRRRSAVWRSTETSWLTPCSAMVTPKSRFMRAMVMGLCVITTKRVSVEAAISSIRLQKRSTL